MWKLYNQDSLLFSKIVLKKSKITVRIYSFRILRKKLQFLIKFWTSQEQL